MLQDEVLLQAVPPGHLRIPGSAMFSVGLRLVSYLPQAGLAAASTVVRVFRVVHLTPAKLAEPICSTVAQMPEMFLALLNVPPVVQSNYTATSRPLKLGLNLCTTAAGSSPEDGNRTAAHRLKPLLTISPVVGSFCTAAVRPTPEEPLPVVYTARGDRQGLGLRNWHAKAILTQQARDATHHDQQQGLLHILMPEDLGGNAGCQAPIDVILAGELLQIEQRSTMRFYVHVPQEPLSGSSWALKVQGQRDTLQILVMEISLA
eukprot:jgi/Astpho2/8966/Aster-x1556